MKCPKCGENLKEGMKFCTKCGVNVEEAKKELEEKRVQEEIAKAQEETKKAKEEIERRAREEESAKNEKAEIEQKLKEEAERAKKEEEEKIRKEEEEKFKREEAERLAKIEADRLKAEEKKEKKKKKEKEKEKEVLQEEKPSEDKFTLKKEEKASKDKNDKKNVDGYTKKVKKKKSIVRRFFNRLLMIIIIAVILVGGVYYLHRQKMLPEKVSDEIDDLIEKFEFVRDNYKDDEKDEDKKDEAKIDWEVEPAVEADDIIDFRDDVSIIKVGKKFGLVDNETGKIVLDTKYDSIAYCKNYKVGEPEGNAKEGIVIEENKVYYSVDSKYQKSVEVEIVEDSTEKVVYYYDHFDEVVYEGNIKFSKFKTLSSSDVKGKSKLRSCTDMNIVTTDGKSAEDDDITGDTFEIDIKKSKVNYSGYFDVTTGKLAIDCNYEEAGEFSEGFAAVTDGDGKAGFIDEDGEVAVEFVFDETRGVHDGLAWAEIDGKWGLVEVK